MARGGRRDRPIDRGSGVVAEFVDDLRRLRGELSLEEVGRRMGYHSSTVSRRLSPDELPPLEFVRAYVRSCQAEPGPWEERWRKIERVTELETSGATSTMLAVPPDGKRDSLWVRRKPYIVSALAVAGVSAAVWLANVLYGGAPPSQAPVLTALPAGSPPPAAEGRGFAWKIERMTARLSSRQWTLSAPGDVEIWAKLTCPAEVTFYRIALYPTGDSVRFACGSWQYHHWVGVPEGLHHFEVWKVDDGRAVSGEGVLRSSVSLVEQPTRG
ncbi:hypothetical protein EDD27_3335 [Nonomuraea polychroma]|uniref:Helix-turn-helix protein n=1 Tax=Nonomuraea polychroma TaxID=46176 RepID=A0A438M4X3_9ACTN|nr:helix-turn-helix domain-containing protein [Nonomuraea polychroma]RVX40894.1 hypothetical protein EDD27_3335 [Nonomuraea polychroma]